MAMTDSGFNLSDIERRMNRALSYVKDFDQFLLEHAAHEQSIAHRLAVYLEREFPGYHVDCEYNRQGGTDDPKKACVTNGELSIVKPDIIVHRRGPEGPNVLAIEVKPQDCVEADYEHDCEKIKRYVIDHDYEWAILVVYTQDDLRIDRIAVRPPRRYA